MESEFTRAFLINSADNIATMLAPGKKGGECSILGERRLQVILAEDIPYGHKIAVRNIQKGDAILKYGQTIGRATGTIPAGCSVHVHNVESLRGRGDVEVKS